jgi:hypothetical protein
MACPLPKPAVQNEFVAASYANPPMDGDVPSAVGVSNRYWNCDAACPHATDGANAAAPARKSR